MANQHNTKKSQYVSYEEFFPYLRDNPDWLEDERIKKASKILNSLQTEEQLADFGLKIQEEIGIESKKSELDEFYISRLKDLSSECKKRFQAEQLKQLNGKA